MVNGSFGYLSPLKYLAVVYFVSSSALAVHEFSHVWAAQYIVKDCIFTESTLRFDMLLIRRSAMTYFTCSQGVERFSPPRVGVVWDDFTLPTLVVRSAKPSGMQQISSPLTTGWFTALMGPVMEIAYVAILLDWLSKSVKSLGGVQALFLPLLVVILWGSVGDFNQALPKSGAPLFIAAYVVSFGLIALLHVTLNREFYSKVFGGSS